MDRIGSDDLLLAMKQAMGLVEVDGACHVRRNQVVIKTWLGNAVDLDRE